MKFKLIRIIILIQGIRSQRNNELKYIDEKETGLSFAKI